MSPGSNNIWPLVLILGLLGLATTTAFSPLDPACSPAATASLDRCSRATYVDDFDVLDESVWVTESHPIGDAWLDAAHATHEPGRLRLTLPGGRYEGAEVRSLRRGRFRDVETRLRVPDAPGALVGFFLYQGVRGANDEIDIEILAGSRRIMFTTWSAGVSTNHSSAVLPFDPSEGFHDYRIEWTATRVAFYVDGRLMEEFTAGIPQQPMFVMSNAWWPHWLEGPMPAEAVALEIEHVAF